MIKKILIILGCNLNMIGLREKNIYGKENYDSINKQILSHANDLGLDCDIFQSNHEGKIIDQIQKSKDSYHGVIINAGALSHYSYAIRDAISSIKLPFIEVHMSNIYSREEFRRTSVLSPVCLGQITGFGKVSYFLALQAIKNFI